jgi:hypothetical protein
MVLMNSGIMILRRNIIFIALPQTLTRRFFRRFLHNEIHPEYGVIIVMERYEPIPVAEWTLERQLQAADLLAKLHGMSKCFIKVLEIKPKCLAQTKTYGDKSYADWVYVLGRFGGIFDVGVIDDIYANLSHYVDYADARRRFFNHDDFNCDQIMLKDDGEMVLVDWQSYNIGGMNEISYFISIGHAWGIKVDEIAVKSFYRERLSFYTNCDISEDELEAEIHVCTVLD